MKTLFYTVFIVAAQNFFFAPLYGQTKYVSTAADAAAFEGYDLVNYFEKGTALHGSTSYYSYYDGLKMLFVNKEHKALFDANPEKYLPAYGGYCATAVSSEKFISPNYKYFTIQNEKLMFFEVRGFFNGKTQWEKNPQINEVMAEKHYNEMLKK